MSLWKYSEATATWKRFQLDFRGINFTRITEGERKRNWDSSRTLVSGSSWTRLRLVAAHSSLALLRWKHVSHAAPCSYLNLTAHASQRSLLQVSLWYALIQTATSPSILVNLGVYLHNGRVSEGKRKGNGRGTSACRGDPRASAFCTIILTRITEGERKGKGRDSKLETYPMHVFL